MSTSRMPLTPASGAGLSAPRSARVSRVPLEKASARTGGSPVTGGRKVAALTVGGMIVLLVVGLLPAVATLVGR